MVSPSAGRELVDMLHTLLADARAVVRQRWPIGLFVLGVVTLVATATLTHDATWLAQLTTPPDPQLVAWAMRLSHWGDFHTGSLGLALGLWLAGLGARRPTWRVAALACFLGASAGGLTTNAIRATVGRPRPIANAPDVLRGPNLEHAYQGFPSSHCGTSSGTAGALLVALPALGVPALVGAGAVAWSRLYLQRHHPTDVLVGSALGILCGVVFGVAARRQRGVRDP